jgi:hypothetical protein
VEVIPPSGPYIVQTAVSLNDISGNNNGIMETSETILAGISVENVGVETADNVTVTISSTDEFVSITDNYEAYGSIAAGETVTIPDGFTWVVADNIPDQHIVSFELSATDGFQTWITYYTLTGFAPLLEAGSITIVDSDGNNNGRLDPGETADIHIETFNNGSFVAIATTGLLSTSSGYITLNNTAFDFGSIEAGTMEEAVFSISVSPDAPVGTAIVFTFYINSGGYAVEHEYAVTIGLIVEDWETGNMSQFDWQTGGNSNWAVSTQNPYEGTYCIKSGSLGDNQSNWLSLTYDVLTADSVSF